MNSRIKQEAIFLFEQNPGEESCGIIVYDQFGPKFFPCKNISPTKKDNFEISSEEYINISRNNKLLAICHSHIDNLDFSVADKEYAEKYCLPIHLYHLPTKTWKEHIPTSYRPKLEGRQFVWGFFDCYSLVRDYFRYNFNISIGDYDRDENSKDLGVQLLENFTKEGFVRIPGRGILQKHNVFVFKTDGIPQHLGIFQGNSKVLHHPRDMLSTITQFNPSWHQRLHFITKHKSL